MKIKVQPDERLDRLAASAQATMDAIDAQHAAFEGTVRLYVAPSGRQYITIVGVRAGRPFAEVFAPVSDEPEWVATIKAVIDREEGAS